MVKLKISLPVRMADLCDQLQKLQLELGFLRSCFRAAGVTAAQGQMLLEIERQEPTTVVNLTQTLGLDKSTVSQTLSQLQRLGWIDLKEDQTDRRYKQVSLTTDGHRRVALVEEHYLRHIQALMNGITDQEVNMIGLGVAHLAHLLQSKRSFPMASREDFAEGADVAAEKSHPLYENL